MVNDYECDTFRTGAKVVLLKVISDDTDVVFLRKSISVGNKHKKFVKDRRLCEKQIARLRNKYDALMFIIFILIDILMFQK